MPQAIQLIVRSAAGLAIVLLLGCRSARDLPERAAAAGDTVAISKVASRFGFERFDVEDKQIVLREKPGVLEMEGDSRRAMFNRVVFWLSAPPVRRWGRWRMLQSDVEEMLAPLIVPSEAVKSEGNRVVLLDPGHGGEDSGATSGLYNIQEKQVTLELAGAVADLLRREGIDARLTRTDDRAMDLPARCEHAATVRADVLVSIHLNSATNTGSSGIEVHILPPAWHPGTADRKASCGNCMRYPGNLHDGANLVLGHALQASLLKHTGAEDRGVRRSRFHVIRCAPCPAALVECGFISNLREAQKLLTPGYRAQIARALAEGLVAYLDTVKRAHSEQSAVPPWRPK
ncbi:MAG: N-acetylmuramoyl-L-alanine amidase [Verrucomicrobiota bacterium]|nr:N-acetylmuramoyl-L-alanine amidase [Verrucomicrobiota bacterium]